MLPAIKNVFSALNRDERGMTVVEIILLISLIVLPIILVLVWFGKDIKNWISKTWNSTRGEADKLAQENPFQSTGGGNN